MNSSVATADHALEPTIAATLRSIATARASGPYQVRQVDELQPRLTQLFRSNGLPDARIDNLRRMGGGASKEQFTFALTTRDQSMRRCVLRMDPMEAAVLTSRAREFAALHAMQGIVPAPAPLLMDESGDTLGRPALVTAFVDGVTKPQAQTTNVSGFGTAFPAELRTALKRPFLAHLAAIHAYDWRKLPPALFQAPTATPTQAALWQLNWWSAVWGQDALERIPMMGLAERWLRRNLPAARDLVLVHSDYRTGNYLFDEQRREISAILDWELVHIGDYHQDLAWIAIKSWSHCEHGVWLASSLMPQTELLETYAALTDRVIDSKTLYFYQVLGLYQCIVICL
ncbi:MAG: phosphotransferase family protein, partial [Gammaproteobacteria bacterium]